MRFLSFIRNCKGQEESKNLAYDLWTCFSLAYFRLGNIRMTSVLQFLKLICKLKLKAWKHEIFAFHSETHTVHNNGMGWSRKNKSTPMEDTHPSSNEVADWAFEWYTNPTLEHANRHVLQNQKNNNSLNLLLI